MHKNFAKTPFLGKSLISLPECHSTNDVMAQLAASREVQHGDMLITEYQSGGKGQRGNSWMSERGKNLLLSVFIKPNFLKIDEAYLLNIIAGLAIARLVDEIFEQDNTQLKWPNDIYTEDRKIAGILIETSLRKTFEYAIIGIGLNVNQSHFPLPTATSLFIESGRSFGILSILEQFSAIFDRYLQRLIMGEKDRILIEYHGRLYWRGEVHRYKSSENVFDAVLIGIDKNGNLVLDCDGVLKHFRTKEVEFIS